MTGTIRCLDAEVRKDIHERIHRTVSKIAESAGTTAEVEIKPVSPIVLSDPELPDWINLSL
jgi:metal-dependent amidase/aminoacylase/carboxypeptidase family protein